MNDAARRRRFEQLVPPMIDPLRRFLIRRTDPATADDVLADTLLVCWRRLEQLPQDPLPWAYGVAKHCLANAERAGRRQRRVAAKVAVLDPPASISPGPGDSADDPVTRALARLRPDDAELLRLWAWEQLGAAEIAQVLGISANAASIRLHRARQRLREELGELGKSEGLAGHEESREGRKR
ncbi:MULTISPECIES: RNA polymerase sigma factor [unclassified Nocardioides]|uniref:RNA polymerase sigma factor n=1 Tax=unclassified Nocardioides TaxID=2615069 RepID=UPI0018863A3E|nr:MULTISPECIES: RNA polymerase sigma factor [unclassified Nocardioides]